MDSTLDKEIKEAIAKNLPTQVGEVLQTQLARLEKLEADIISKDNLNRRINDDLQQANSDLDLCRSTLEKHDSLDLRETLLAERERNIKIKELELELKAEKRVSESFHEFITSLTKNSILKESFTKNIMHGSHCNSGGTVYYPIGESVCKTTERE